MTKKETYEKKLQNIIDEIQFYEIYYKWSLIISITLISIAMLSLCLYFVINSMKSNIFLRIYFLEQNFLLLD
jgi:predicted metal-dependent peptidase